MCVCCVCFAWEYIANIAHVVSRGWLETCPTTLWPMLLHAMRGATWLWLLLEARRHMRAHVSCMWDKGPLCADNTRKTPGLGNAENIRQKATEWNIYSQGRLHVLFGDYARNTFFICDCVCNRVAFSVVGPSIQKEINTNNNSDSNRMLKKSRENKRKKNGFCSLRLNAARVNAARPANKATMVNIHVFVHRSREVRRFGMFFFRVALCWAFTIFAFVLFTFGTSFDAMRNSILYQL